MEYNQATEGDGVLMQTATWRDLEDIIPRERSQTQKATDFIVPFTQNVPNRQAREKEVGLCFPRAGAGVGAGEGE